MTDHNVAVITFTESSKAYEALSDLKRAGLETRIGVRSAVIVERESDGRMHVAEGQDAMIGTPTVAGSLLGMLLGLLGGPLGVLLGWGAGALFGGYFDMRRENRRDSVIGDFSQSLPPGVTGIVAELEEVTPEVLDNVMTPLGGTVLRRPAGMVLAELEAAEDAANAADKEARKELRREKREARETKWQERVDALAARFRN